MKLAALALALLALSAGGSLAVRQEAPEPPAPPEARQSDLARRVAAACAARKVFDWSVDWIDRSKIIVWCYDPRRPSRTTSVTIPRNEKAGGRP